MEQEKLNFSSKEAAAAAGISMPTMLAWLHQDGFPAFRAGKKWLIPVEPFKRWLTAQCEQGKTNDGQ